jgi:hypothetical protein
MNKSPPPSYESLYGFHSQSTNTNANVNVNINRTNTNTNNIPQYVYYSYPSQPSSYIYNKPYKSEDDGLICCRLL